MHFGSRDLTLNRITHISSTVITVVCFAANLEVYEVEEFLADILNHEFDTIADDGSLREVSVFDKRVRS